MQEIQLALQSAQDALRDFNDKVSMAMSKLDTLLNAGEDTPVPYGDVERLQSQGINMQRTLERILR